MPQKQNPSGHTDQVYHRTSPHAQRGAESQKIVAPRRQLAELHRLQPEASKAETECPVDKLQSPKLVHQGEVHPCQKGAFFGHTLILSSLVAAPP